MQVVILAAGQGARMGAEIPKVLMPIAGKPMIEYLISSIISSGVDRRPIIVVSPDNHAIIKQALEKYNCQYALQNEQLGTGHALACAKNLVEKNCDYVISFYGDHPFVKTETIKKLARGDNGFITMMTVKLENFKGWRRGFWHWGRIVRDSKGEVEEICEFKDADEEIKKIREVNPGFYCFQNKWLWENIDKLKNNNTQKEYYLTDLIKSAGQQNLKINSLLIGAKEAIGVNTHEELKAAERLV